ncbi:hypothetical protein [Mesorhizobium sp.]|nr:hypothetical protein [Mesorhizobium sp.]
MNMQRFIFRALFAMRQSGSVAVWKAPYGQSGKEAEKPIGKILERTAFTKTSLAMLRPI